MGNLVFQATLGGQVNLVGPNTASTFNINVPAIAGTLVTTGDTGTVTNTMLAGSIANAKLTNSSVTIGSTSVALGATVTAFTGITTLAMSSDLTLSGGTANGVAYLNGSKVLTTGSALTFDGTNFGATASIISGSMGTLYATTYSAGNSQTWLTNNASASDTYRTSDTAQRYRMLTGVGFTWETATSGTAGAGISWAEQMRLTSTGLGIGNSSPAYKLDVTGTARVNSVIAADGANGTVQFGSASTYGITGGVDNGGFRFNLPSGVDYQFRFAGSDAMRLTITGLGIGTSSPNANVKLDASGPIRAGGYTVATLPTGVVGARAYVTDAVTAVFMATPTGGGSVKTPVFFNGSVWVCG
jgi:hypothetical protein